MKADAVMATDELNVIRTFDDYFGVMGITKEQKKARIDFAGALLDAFLFFFAYAKRIKNSPSFKNEAIAKAKEVYIAALPSSLKRNGAVSDEYLKKHITTVATSIALTTVREIDYDWYLTYDRAFDIAGTEANSVLNYTDYEDAIKAGYTTKTWNTIMDGREREAHGLVDGVTIPIDEFFNVGSDLMRFPHDDLYGSAENLVNCRCWLTYGK